MRVATIFVVLALALIGSGNGFKLERNLGGGNVPGKTLGKVWPQPQTVTQNATYVVLDPQTFDFIYQGIGCGIIQTAIDRYRTIIFDPPRYAGSPVLSQHMSEQNVQAVLPSLTISYSGSNCETAPYLGMDESYQLRVNTQDEPGVAQLTAASTWGIIRGLESFSQLVYHDDARNFYANSTDIDDFPRFAYRGFMLDTARHYVSLNTILQHLDAMAFNKFNVFHWHLTDDQSFPYESQDFPSLSLEGSYNPKTHVYSFDDISMVISYANERGIRVVPEFDSPGHTLSWGSIAGLLTPCYTNGVPDGTYGPIDPSKEATFDFLTQFFSEATRIFPDKYFHLGGDEVDFSCWASNPDIVAFMQQMGYGTNFQLLETYYMGRLIDIVSTIQDSKDYIVWQEVFDNGGQLNSNTVVNVWKDGYKQEMQNVTSNGYQAILSSCWYLNIISYGVDWPTYYACDPHDFIGNATMYDLVVGGEGCMWAEYVDAANLISRTWPRASAVAERLWSNEDVTDVAAATPRLDELTCKLIERGINAEPPNGPNFCEADYLIE